LLYVRIVQNRDLYSSYDPMKKNNYTSILIFLLTITPTLILTDNFLIPSKKAISETENSNKEEEQKKYISDDGMVHLQNEMDILELIKAVSEINEEVYLIDESVKPQKVSIITPEGGMEKEYVLRFFEIILNMNGLTVVKSDGINKVINSGRIKEESIPTIIDQSQ